MTRQEVLDCVRRLTPEHELEWMFDLGAHLTISARGAYAIEEVDGNVTQLMGFNELQHKIYGRTRELRRGGVWTLDSFLDGLVKIAKHYGIEGDLGWAVKASLRNIEG